MNEWLADILQGQNDQETPNGGTIRQSCDFGTPARTAMKRPRLPVLPLWEQAEGPRDARAQWGPQGAGILRVGQEGRPAKGGSQNTCPFCT